MKVFSTYHGKIPHGPRGTVIVDVLGSACGRGENIMVKIQIRERNVEVPAGLRKHVEQRLNFALARFGQRIARVIVRFSDGDAGDGETGHNLRCQIHVGLRSRSARVEDTDNDLFVAVVRAAERVSRSVARVLERERDWDAGMSRPLAKP
jgi:putative sigma-54 modulation protein